MLRDIVSLLSRRITDTTVSHVGSVSVLCEVIFGFGGWSVVRKEGAEFIILECVPSVKKMFFHAKQALHTSHITRTQFHYLITRDCACLNC